MPSLIDKTWRDQRVDVVASIGAALCRQNAGGMLKTVEDLDRYRHIFDEVHPGLIVETGTFQGVSALWFADTAGCSVITMDIAGEITHNIWKRWAGRVRMFVGDSVDPGLVEHVHQLVHARESETPVMVVLDSDHSAKHVAAEIAAYAGLVTIGSFLVVEDTLARWMPWFNIDGSPMDAVEALLEQNAGWEVDVEVETMSDTTQHPCGWLRRVS